MPATNESRLDNFKSVIRALLIAKANQRVTIWQLSGSYKEMEGEPIPFKEFGFNTLQDFLNSMPDTCRLCVNGPKEIYVYHVDTEETAHLTSLVARQKRPQRKSRSMSAYSNRTRSSSYNNFTSRPQPRPQSTLRTVPINVLSQVLQEIKQSTSYTNNNGIRKIELLNKVREKCGGYAIYSIEQLNRQLYEFLHEVEVKHDFIQFKDLCRSSIPNDNNKEKEIKIVEVRANDYIEYCPNYDNTGNKIKNTLDESSERIKFRLQKLIEKHPEGIWCAELPNVYRDEYKIDLEYHNYGFNSVPEFVAALPDVFSIVEPGNTKRQMLLDARKSYNGVLENNDTFNQNQTKTLASQYNFQDYIPNGPDPIPTKLSSKISRTLIPDGLMNLDESIDQINVTSLKCDYEDYIEINISEIFTPSFFWVTLRKNKRKIKLMMNEIDEFYHNSDLSKYKIPQVVLEPGLNIACIYARMWHRGIIKKIKPDGFVIILFYDYGTVKTYDPNDLYFLHKRFSFLPAQAIPCALHNVRPIGKTEWDTYATNKFVSKVWGIPLIAVVPEVDEEKNTMMLSLTDTSDDTDDIHINDWMVENGLAEYGRMPYKVPPVNKVCMYDEDLLKKLNDEERQQINCAATHHPVHNINQNDNSDHQRSRRGSCVYTPNMSLNYVESAYDTSTFTTLVKENMDLTKQTNTIAQAILLNMPINKTESTDNVADSVSVTKNAQSPSSSHQTYSNLPDSEHFQNRFSMGRNSNVNSIKKSSQELNNDFESNYVQNGYTDQNGTENIESRSSKQSLYSCPSTFDNRFEVTHQNTPVHSRQSVRDRRSSVLSSHSGFSSNADFEPDHDDHSSRKNSFPNLGFQDSTPYFEIKTALKSKHIEIKYPTEFAKMQLSEPKTNCNLENDCNYEKTNPSTKTYVGIDEGYSSASKHASQNRSDLTASSETLSRNSMYSLTNLSEKCDRKAVHLFHIDNEGWVCASEFTEAFTNLKDQRVMFKLLEFFEFNVNFKQLTRDIVPELFSLLDKSTLKAPREHDKIVPSFVLHLIPLKATLQILVKLDFVEARILKEAASFMKQCKNDAENLMYERYNNKILFDALNLLKKYGEFKKATLKLSNQ